MPLSPQTLERYLASLKTEEGRKAENLALLEVVYGNTTVASPGVHLDKATVEKQPSLRAAVPFDRSYIVICLDLDPPFPSFPVLGPIVHWIQQDLIARPSISSPTTAELVTITDSKPIKPYKGAGPPPLSAPHRYVFLLYEQPAGFSSKKFEPEPGQEMALWPRIRWRLEAFEKEAGLGRVVAANYFVADSAGPAA